MHSHALRCLVAAAALAAVLPAAAAEESTAAACEPHAASLDPLADRAATQAHYEQLPPACLREIFTACTAAAGQTLLDLGSAAVCSFGYEAFLKQAFGGNFRALMAWWRSQKDEALQ
jgi:hypothetical protein